MKLISIHGFSPIKIHLVSDGAAPPHGSDPWSMPGSSAQSSSYPGGMIGGTPQYSQAPYMSHPPPPGRDHMVCTVPYLKRFP